jgi:hypothetical protein
MSSLFVIDGARGEALARRSAILAFGVGLVLALASSGSIVLERVVATGSARFAFASSVLVACISALAFGVTLRSQSAIFLFGSALARLRTLLLVATQLGGVAIGITLTHLALQRFGTATWLSEGPRQFVNDAVANVAIVTVMRACGARSFSSAALAVGLALVTLYSLTASLWHVDRPPHPFEVGVQQLVLSQVVSAASALFTTRLVFVFFSDTKTNS